MEKKYGDEEEKKSIRQKLPRTVRKRRRVNPDDPVHLFIPQSSGIKALKISKQKSDMSTEEYYDYIFPDDESTAPNIKLLEAARKWKEKQEALLRAKKAKAAEEES